MKDRSRYSTVRMTHNAHLGGARHRSAPSGHKHATPLEHGSFAAVRKNTAGIISLCALWVGTHAVLTYRKHSTDWFSPFRVEFPINMYDVRRPCDRSPDKDGPLCYKQLEWIPVWLNEENIKNALGANPAITYNGSSPEVFQDFFTSGDLMHYSAGLLTDLVNDGIRLLVYAGETGETLRPSSLLVCSCFGRRCL